MRVILEGQTHQLADIQRIIGDSSFIDSVDYKWIGGNPLIDELYYQIGGTPIRQMELNLEGIETLIQKRLKELTNIDYPKVKLIVESKEDKR